MLELKHITKVYRPKKGVPVKALDNVSLKIQSKGMVFILGKSGSGKSTLLNIIGGLDRYDHGELIIKGKSSKDFTQSDFDSYRNTYVGFIFQEYNILEDFSVGANIGLALELQGKKATEEAINRILQQVDLEGYGHRKPNELSGGQKQRVAIARALVKEPEIILADEPTGNLDSETGKQVFDTLKKLSQEKLVIVVSHDREFAETYGDRIIELADGKIIRDIERV
ncbi:MAG TPA: ABC transporter ATP-binding protein, partial [Haloplasmataceae bacterium]